MNIGMEMANLYKKSFLFAVKSYFTAVVYGKYKIL